MIRVKVTFANGDTGYIETVAGVSIHESGVLSFEQESNGARVQYSPVFWQRVETEAPTPYDLDASVM